MGNYFAVPAPLLQIVSIEVGTKQEIGPRQIYVAGRGGKSSQYQILIRRGTQLLFASWRLERKTVDTVTIGNSDTSSHSSKVSLKLHLELPFRGCGTRTSV